jgi:phosphatidate cytidylyltransferase
MKEFITKYKKRLQTAIILIIALATILYINSPFVYTITIWGISMVAVYEAKYMLKLNNMIFINISVFLIYIASFWVNDVYLLVILVYIIALSCKTYLYNFEEGNLLIILYPILGLSFLLSILNNFPSFIFIFLILAVASTDIGAFIVGKKIGKTQFSETSPNKTIEGVIGGVVIGTVVAGLFAIIVDGNFIMVAIAFFVSLISVFGDLYESSLKRKADLKDSGSILPGHGGVLDRLDGYIFSAPVLFILLKIFI